MLMTKERRSAIRTLRGWAISVLQDAGAIRECEEHGWMQDRADPYARERAVDVTRQARQWRFGSVFCKLLLFRQRRVVLPRRYRRWGSERAGFREPGLCQGEPVAVFARAANGQLPARERVSCP
jgi:hypothetical protein